MGSLKVQRQELCLRYLGIAKAKGNAEYHCFGVAMEGNRKHTYLGSCQLLKQKMETWLGSSTFIVSTDEIIILTL